MDKSIQEKVNQMMNRSSSFSQSEFLRMDKIQLEDYFNKQREEALDKIHEDLEKLIKERTHYKTFILNEKINLDREIALKYPLKLNLETKTFFDLTFKRFEMKNS